MSRQEEDFRKQAEWFADETRETPEEKFQTRHDYLAGCEYGYQYALQRNRWIPVEERLPEKDDEFEDFSKLVVVTNGKYFWKGMYNYVDNDWRTSDLWLIDDATHWMEIVPPKKEE